jgi:phosphate/sulfate permease
MKRTYLILAIIGFIVPNIFVMMETVETGNILLWLDAKSTFEAVFLNNITTAFITDLLFVVLVFFVWTYRQALRYRMKNIYIIWIVTLLFGMAGAFPLFLYMREIARKKRKRNSTQTRKMETA